MSSLERLDRIKNKDQSFVLPPLSNAETKPDVSNLFSNLANTVPVSASGFASVLPGRRDAGVAVYSKLQELKCISVCYFIVEFSCQN